ncbi:MAG: NlpC/P60 family protein [Vulcanimicrobiota bacterium]
MFINQSFSPFGPMMANPMVGAYGGMQSTIGMMHMMQMMMQMMQMVMGMMYGQSAQSMGNPGFGGGGCPGCGASPLGNFLGAPGGAGHGMGPGGAAAAANPTGGGSFLPPAPDGSTNSKTQNFIDRALAKQGAPYVFGAAGNGKYDCSGLVHAALNEAGVKGQRLTARGYQAKYKNSMVRKEDLKPGDLVFFHSKNDRGIPSGQATHIEIYLGNGMTMGTDSPKEGARVEPINWDTFIGGARVPELAG